MKKRLLTAVLAFILALSMSISAYATGGTTMLTVVVPGPTYTLNIPVGQSIEYGVLNTRIDVPYVSDPTGFVSGRNVVISIAHDSFTAEGISTTIPYSLCAVFSYSYMSQTGSNMTITEEIFRSMDDDSLTFSGNNDGTISRPSIPDGKYTATLKNLELSFDSSSWANAIPGEYSTTITYTSEVQYIQ